MDLRMSNYGTDIIHHSRFSIYRQPFGAVPMGESVLLRISVAESFPDVTALCAYWIDDDEKVVEMEPVQINEPLGRRWYEATLEMPSHTGLAWYAFILNDGMRLIYYGSKAGGGRGETYDALPPPFQITVYDPSFKTPEWFKGATMYQIFVDRFRRGSELGGLERAGEHTRKGREIKIHADWNEQPYYQAERGEEHYTPNDFFGGDLKGVIDKLPYLRSLGVDVIYFNPIFESPSNHKYDTGDYRRVDPMFGDEEILKELCEKAKGLGISVMLDGVFSHTGADSLYFNRDGRYEGEGAYQGIGSPYYNWFIFFHHPDKYASWWGFQSLPEVNEMHKDYRDFIMGEKDCVLEHWSKAGIRGWRLDVADELPEAFIREMRSRLKALSGEYVLLGEVWEDASTKESMGVKRQYVMGKELDSVMNYPFRSAVLDFFLGRADAHGLNSALSRLRENFPEPFFYSAMNMLSTHDVPRALSLLSGAPDKDAGLTREEQAAYELSDEQLERGIKRMKLASLLQFAYPGVASVYYGDEAGCQGLMDPFNRGTYPWGSENMELLKHYRRLALLKKHFPDMRYGGMVMGAPENNVIAVVRFTDGTSGYEYDTGESISVILINRALSKVRVPLRFQMLMEGPDALRLAFMDVDGVYHDVFSGREYICADSMLDIDLPPLTAAVLMRKEDD